MSEVTTTETPWQKLKLHLSRALQFVVDVEAEVQEMNCQEEQEFLKQYSASHTAARHQQHEAKAES